jgi:hypothetical protein
MSDDEEQLAIGRIVTDYKKAKQRLTALQSEATNIGQLMQRMGQTLTFAKPGSANFTPEHFAKLSHEKILSLVNEIHTVWAEVERLRQQLNSLGLSDAQT